MNIPEPSRQPFFKPLGVEALRYFCHPRHEVFRRPVRYKGGVWAANGYAAIRVTRGLLTFDDTIPEAYPEFGEAMDKLPWDLVETREPTAVDRAKLAAIEKELEMTTFKDANGRAIPPAGGTGWRDFDSSRATIYKKGSNGESGVKPLWVNGRMTEECPVWTAASCLVPLAMLQLLARLPKGEVRMGTGDFLGVRFYGGEAIIPGRWRHVKEEQRPKAKFKLFLGKEEAEMLRERREAGR